ncbi:MAG: ATP-binding protein [Lachnospiraceae bacterium]|nr:ATP-binding protein [Lachnospiraceae bacterium]
MSLTNQQYESIMRGYERTRDLNRDLETARREEIYKKIPEYLSLDQSVATTATAKVRQLLGLDENDNSDLHSKLQSISAQKKELLIKNGYPEDYLDPVYTCALCHDTGYVEDGDGGKTKCKCFRNQEISILYEQSNIREQVSRENFQTLSYDYYEGEDLERFKKAANICHEFVDGIEKNYQNLFLYGTVGTGKSFLSGCVANELLRQGKSVIYFSSFSLFDTLARYSFDQKSKESLYNFTKDLYNCDLVIIDDLGTEVTNSFVTSQLFSLLNERCIRKKACIISTNLSLEELRDRYSDRIFSRITSNYALCKLTGPDIRMYRKRQMNNRQV